MASKRPRDEEEPSTSVEQSDSKRSKREDSDTDIEKARQCYKDIVRSVSNSSLRRAWNDVEREAFLARIDRVENAKDILHQLKDFESHLVHNKTPGGIQWKKQYWIWITNLEIIENFTVTRFIICLKFMEEHMLRHESRSKGWTDTRKEKWLKSCGDLIHPFDELALCDNMYLNTKALFIQFRFESHLAYDRTIDEVIVTINDAVKELEKAKKKIWPENALSAISIIAGFYDGVFAWIVELTTSLGVKILEHHRIWDDKSYQKVKGELEKISDVTMALTELLQHYRSAANRAMENLPNKSDVGLADLKEFELLECESCVKVPDHFTVDHLQQLLTIVRPKVSNELLKQAGKTIGRRIVLTGARKLAEFVPNDHTDKLEFLKTGLIITKSIHDMISSKKEVNTMAKQFRNLANTLNDVRDMIHECYDFPKNEHLRNRASGKKGGQK